MNLSYCKDEFINFNIPVSIDENNLFKYDPNNEYYKDECFPYTNEYGTDILINDRQNEFNNNNLLLCENNCTYNGYDNITKKSKCECLFKSKDIIISEIMNQTNDLYYNFISKEESSNMITMKCVRTLFTKNGLIKNIGSYILLFTILLFIISGILFYKCGYILLEDDINEAIEKRNNKMIKRNINTKETIGVNIKKNINNKKGKIIKTKTLNKKTKNKKISRVSKSNRIYINTSNNPSSISKLKLNKNNLFPTKTKNKKKKKFIKKKKSKNSINYNDYELNSLIYEEARIYDKRDFITYFISLIRAKHPIIFSFCPLKDYNSRIIKIDLFFLSFSIYCFVNCLFCNESMIHKIYKDEGIYNFGYLISYISYSFIIANTIFIIIKYFSLSEKNISELKYEKTKQDSYEKSYKVKKCLTIKYICFFCLSILFLSFFWYYLSSFCAVYQNTQIYLIKNILISFSFSLVYPFIINLIPGIFRIYSLKGSGRNFIFKISKFIQFI